MTSWGGSTADDRDRELIEMSLSDALGDDQLAEWQRLYLDSQMRGATITSPPPIVVTGGRRSGKSYQRNEAWSAYLEAHQRRSAALRRRERRRAARRVVLSRLRASRRLLGLWRHPAVSATAILGWYVLLLAIAYSPGR